MWPHAAIEAVRQYESNYQSFGPQNERELLRVVGVGKAPVHLAGLFPTSSDFGSVLIHQKNNSGSASFSSYETVLF